MSTELITLLIFLSLFTLLITGFPVAFSLMAVSAIWLFIIAGTDFFGTIPATIFETGTREIFVAVPLFILMAIGLEKSGIGTQIYDALYKWTAGLPGGMAIGTLAAAAIIAAMTGIGGTAVLVLGVLAIPEMLRRNYDVRTAIGGLAPAGALGVLIPPTVVGVLLGGFAGIPIGHLFFGAAIPGLLIGFLFCLYVLTRCALSPQLAPSIPMESRPTWADRVRAIGNVIVPCGLIFLVLGSIWGGVATPSEASGIGAFGTLVIGLLRGKFDFATLRDTLESSARLSVMVLTLLIGGALFARLLQFSGSAQLVAEMVVGIELGVVATLLLFIVVITILGMFIDAAAIIFIVTPIMMPVIRMLGIDPVWFGVLLMISVAAAYVTPPFGMNLFYLRGIIDQIKDKEGCEALQRISIADIWIACVPYVLIMYVVLALVIVFPELATWLPSR